MPYLLLTFARTRRFTSGVPCWDTRASAFAACDRSLIGYERDSGIAKVELLSLFRFFAFNLAMIFIPARR